MNQKEANPSSIAPLAAQMRPSSLDQMVGQTQLIGPGRPLRVAIERGILFSFLLWGPPGVGKTTLARIYARSVKATLYELSAVSTGKDDVRKVITAAEISNEPTVLFLDEIHRFNKAQQDYLLPYVESGSLILVGATTENPSFAVIPALLSRCRVFVLESLTQTELLQLVGQTGLVLDEPTAEWLVRSSGGDARQLLSLIEQAQALYGELTQTSLTAAGQVRLRYDKDGDEHYSVVSAFIKSLRASNPDAAIYYLARMLEGGEDPLFIARRMVVFASEDVGLAQPTALVVANAVFRAVETVGLPEAAINLAHGVAYLAKSKKDRSAYTALRAAQQVVQQTGNLQVPAKLRNAPTNLLKDLGYGQGYEMYDDTNLLPEQLIDKKFFSE